MRIVGYIENPTFKITIMHMNLRYAVKFENEGIEQTYKIRESENIKNVEDVKALVDKDILDQITILFSKMELTRLKMINKNINDFEDFEEII